jgi:hypothetical protein
MRKLFEIDESEKQRILEMHINASKNHYLIEQKKDPPRKDALKTQVTNTGENENTIFDLGPFQSRTVPDDSWAGRLGVLVSGENLYYVKYDRNIENYTTNGAVDISGKPEDFTVDLNTKTVTNSKFITNMSIVSSFGGFSSVLDKGAKPGMYQVIPTFPEGFQTVMINYPRSNAPSQIDKFAPYLCTVVLDVKKIETLIRDGINKRVPSNSSTINLLQYYVPKSKEEWYVMRNNLDSKNTETSIDFSEWSFKKFKRKKIAIFLSDWWPNSSHGKTNVTDPTPKPRDRFVPRSVGGNVGEPFIFNKTQLAPGGEAQIKKFVDQFLILKRTDPDLYDTYIKELDKKYKDTGINVYAYSSIDNDPNEIITYVEGPGGNAVDKCGGKQLRSLYNKCLSDRRAEVIAAELNKQLPDFPDFIGIGKGESKSVNGVGWTKGSPTTEPQTLPNRRFEVDLPEYSDVKSVGNN